MGLCALFEGKRQRQQTRFSTHWSGELDPDGKPRRGGPHGNRNRRRARHVLYRREWKQLEQLFPLLLKVLVRSQYANGGRGTRSGGAKQYINIRKQIAVDRFIATETLDHRWNFEEISSGICSQSPGPWLESAHARTGRDGDQSLKDTGRKCPIEKKVIGLFLTSRHIGPSNFVAHVCKTLDGRFGGLTNVRVDG